MSSTTSRATLRRVALSITGLALTGATFGGVAAPATAIPLPQPAEHVAATELSAAARAKEVCALPGNADDSVLRTLKAIADSRRVSSKVRLAMFETAWVESHAHSLPCGHADSMGVFQQRPSQGWGSNVQIQDPAYATNKFLNGNGTKGAIAVAAAHPGWTAGQVSQRVQGSARPYEYDKAERTAQALITRSNQIASGVVKAGNYRWPQVQYGEHNNRVIAIQQLLNHRGNKLAADGSFGPGTRTAVRNFQSRNGLRVDGVVGPNTWAKLIIGLRKGSSGAAVKALQHELTVHGYQIKISGSYDAATVNAVTTFRKGHKLPSGTITDSNVWNTLIAIKR